MKTFNIVPPDQAIRSEIVNRIDNLTKPRGALGRLEEIALRVGLIQQTVTPQLLHPHAVLFGADHGIVSEGVSASPKEVTRQQMEHFAQGCGGINFLCRQHGFVLKVVDAGVDFDFPPDSGVIDRKVRRGTGNFLYQEAMSADQFAACILHGAEVTDECHRAGCNIIAFGEMGVGNTSASSLLMAFLTGLPLERCVGAGSGLNDDGVRHKLSVLNRAYHGYHGPADAQQLMCRFGGLEMAMAVGGMLAAAERRMTVLVDGFIMGVCMLVSASFYPQVMEYAIFGHQGEEAGHRLLLRFMGVNPLLHLGLRLGEGSGAVCAFPIVDSAVRMINQMDSFFQASVTKYF